jgi:hypothetical protein
VVHSVGLIKDLIISGCTVRLWKSHYYYYWSMSVWVWNKVSRYKVIKTSYNMPLWNTHILQNFLYSRMGNRKCTKSSNIHCCCIFLWTNFFRVPLCILKPIIRLMSVFYKINLPELHVLQQFYLTDNVK